MKRGQVWYGDFILGIIIFSVGLAIFFNFLTDYTSSQTTNFDVILKEGQSMSSQLVGEGTPSDWNSSTVFRIGITSGDHIIDEHKMHKFSEIAYNRSKEIFGISHNYVFFGQNSSGNVVSIEGECVQGHPDIHANFTPTVAYYRGGSLWLETEVDRQFTVDLYDPGLPGSQFTDLLATINSYPLVVLEDPQLTYAAATQTGLENFVDNGGTLVVIGQLYTADGQTTAGSTWYTKPAQTSVDRNATISGSPSFYQNAQHYMQFESAQYVENQSIAAANFTEISVFEDDNAVAVALWRYGSGQVFYLSDAKAEATEGNFTQIAYRMIANTASLPCNQVSLGATADVVRFERFVLYDGKITKLVVFLWK